MTHRPRRRSLLSALALIASLPMSTAYAAGTPELTLESCRMKGLSTRAECGTFTVFEDRVAGSGRTIDLRVVVVPAQASKPETRPRVHPGRWPGTSGIRAHRSGRQPTR